MSSAWLGEGLGWNQGSVGDEFLPVHEAFACLLQKLFNLDAVPKSYFLYVYFKGSVFSYCFSLSTKKMRSSSAELSAS